MVIFSRGEGILPFSGVNFYYEKLIAIFRVMCVCAWG